MNARFVLSLLVCAILVLGCIPQSPPGFNEQNVSVSAQSMSQYPALFSVDRLKMGFSPLPTNGTVRILTVDRAHWNLEYAPPNYDISFQFYEGSSSYPYSSRFVALKSDKETSKWVSEQLTFNGPKSYVVDGVLINESIVITAETAQVAFQGTNIQGTVVSYSGPDRQLSPNGDHVVGLALSQIGPVLRKWGYSYDADFVQTNNPTDAVPAAR